jgi:hypothetical protein
MIGAAKDTRDTKIAWLVSLDNMGISLRRLRKDAPTLCLSETAASSKSDINLMSTAERAIARLGLKLMDTWGISRKELLEWMDLGADEYAKRMAFQGFIVSHSSNSQHGQTKKSRKK